MNILVLGSGGREHALAWKIAQSPLTSSLFIAPGNAGTALCGTNLPFNPVDFDKVKLACIEHQIGMVVVGPEEPLVKGIYDFIKTDPELKDVMVIGPSGKAAMLEGSKAFAKRFMNRNNIPTAGYQEFDMDNYTDGVAYLAGHSVPIVLKADGLAAGKGVIIAKHHVEAMAEFELMLQQAKFGDAGKKVVVEEFLDGVELSIFVLTDGKDYLILPEAKDYKRIGVGDTGLNTGGMGAVSPVPFADEVFMQKVKEKIIEPTIRGLQQEELEYCGFVFIGLISIDGEPFVIEYNCRLGDPETEVVLPRIKNDIVEIFSATAQGKLKDIKLEIDSRAAATVMAVSGGYPGNYETGFEIDGLDVLNEDDVIVFQAGTSLDENKVLTKGGRVLTVTAYGAGIPEAVKRALKILEFISFEGMYYRKDIGFEFQKKEETGEELKID